MSVRILWGIMSLMMLFTAPVFASSPEEELPQLWEEELQAFREVLPSSLREVMEDPMDAERVADVWDIGGIWASMKESLAACLPSASALLFRLMGLLCMAGISHHWSGGLRAASSPAWELLCSLCLLMSAVAGIQPLLRACEVYISALSSLMGGVSPIACVLTAASGQLSTAAVMRGMLMLLYTFVEQLYAVCLLPAVRVSFCIGIISGLSPILSLDAIGRCVRRIFGWFLGLLGLFLSFIMGAQTVMARSADSFTVRTVKFALGSFVPLVGGALSESLTTAASGLSLIRSSCGIVAIAAVLMLFLPLLIEPLLHRTVLALCGGAAEMLGCDREGKVLSELHGMVGIMLALCAVVSLLFLFVLILLIGMTPAGGGL